MLTTTAGDASANSYASVAEADAYLAVRGNTSAWAALTTEQKESKLQWAALHLDTLTFRGSREFETQALQWPRYGVTDRDSFTVSGVPVALKRAQSEMAFQFLSQDWTQGPDSMSGALRVGSLSLGEEVYKPFPSAVLALLKPFLACSPSMGGRLVRG